MSLYFYSAQKIHMKNTKEVPSLFGEQGKRRWTSTGNPRWEVQVGPTKTEQTKAGFAFRAKLLDLRFRRLKVPQIRKNQILAKIWVSNQRRGKTLGRCTQPTMYLGSLKLWTGRE